MRSAPVFEPDPFKGVVGPTLVKNRPKTYKSKTKMIMFPRGLTSTKVIYAMMMFRVSRATNGRSFRRVTVDVIMHYDMLWHVVIDMVDQVTLC